LMPTSMPLPNDSEASSNVLPTSKGKNTKHNHPHGMSHPTGMSHPHNMPPYMTGHNKPEHNHVHPPSTRWHHPHVQPHPKECWHPHMGLHPLGTHAMHIPKPPHLPLPPTYHVPRNKFCPSYPPSINKWLTHLMPLLRSWHRHLHPCTHPHHVWNPETIGGTLKSLWTEHWPIVNLTKGRNALPRMF
jgi:hypothetical protein